MKETMLDEDMQTVFEADGAEPSQAIGAISIGG